MLAARTALLLFACACGPSWEIGLQEGSTAEQLSFSLSRAGRPQPAVVAIFRVDACTARGNPPIDTHWMVAAPDTAEAVRRIDYGVPPSGWRSAAGPHPLAPGCYRAAVSGAPPLEFDVMSDGSVTARR